MAPEKYEQEARVAVELGYTYTSLKIKTRLWFDVYETIQLISAVTPDWFCIDADWNDFLINVSNAVPVLQQLEQEFPKLKIFEGLIQANDVPGNRLLRSQIRTPIAHHYGAVPGRTAIGEGYCDGFVYGQYALFLTDGRNGLDNDNGASLGHRSVTRSMACNHVS